ncbi:MAG: type II toxin-antitoxin system prevent-host-death family antitoxin [Oligoflexus sp.]|nr:type II toxin-antitoxin system prevent-host-death family antitoxin [Oligoflexus sp.]
MSAVEDDLKFHSWSIRDAKAKLSEVIEEAQSGMPQLITNHGKPQALLLKVGSISEIEEILATRKAIRRRTLLDSLSAVKAAALAEGVDRVSYERENGREVDFRKDSE